MVRTLEERRFPVSSLRLLASSRSAGEVMSFHNEPITVEEATPERFEGYDLALFSAGGGVSKELAPEAWARGCIVIDNSSAWRMDPDCPLVVPEVNPEALDGYATKGIIGNPNCSTIQMVVALKPLHDAYNIKQIVVSTYQSASGAGQKGMEELSQQTIATLNMAPVPVETFQHQLAFNVIPHIDVFQDDDFTREEHKMIFETRKILGEPELTVHPTCVRVPVVCSHSESIFIETEQPIDVAEAKELLASFPGIEVTDSPADASYPMPLAANGQDPVYVGRIRQTPGETHTLNLWVVSDNLRKGAALNAVQIAEVMIQDYLAH
jgi:aspartate-semialdehyde dehydrogenase